MYRSVERIDLDKPVKPFSHWEDREWQTFVPLDVDTGLNVIPLDIYTHQLRINDKRAPRVYVIYAAASPNTLRQYGLIERNNRFSNERYEIPEYNLEIFQKLCFQVKLPDVDTWLTAYPWQYGLTKSSSLEFFLFKQPEANKLPLFRGFNRMQLNQLRWSLPALTLPAKNLPRQQTERGRGFLAITQDPAYHREIEIKFELNKTVLERPLPDWSVIYGDCTREELQPLYRDLSKLVANQRPSKEVINRWIFELEVEQTIRMLKEQGKPADWQSAFQALMRDKESQLDWIEKRLRELSR